MRYKKEKSVNGFRIVGGKNGNDSVMNKRRERFGVERTNVRGENLGTNKNLHKAEILYAGGKEFGQPIVVILEERWGWGGWGWGGGGGGGRPKIDRKEYI